MKIIFMGTPAAAAHCLKALIEAKLEILAVISQPDKPKGRNLQLSPSPVKELALKYSLKVKTPEKIKDEAVINEIKNLAPDLIVVVAYGKLLPKELLAIPKYGAINVHASLLPKYRGAAPIQWAILNGEKETGITIMQLDAGLDTGDVLLQEKLPIDENDTAETLLMKLFKIGARLLIKATEEIQNGTIKSTRQKEAEASYARIIKKEDGLIDFSKSAEEINNQIRAMFPWPGAYIFLKGKRLKINQAAVLNEKEKHAPGEILEAGKKLIIACGTNALEIKELQLEGGKALFSENFLQGHKINKGEVI